MVLGGEGGEGGLGGFQRGCERFCALALLFVKFAGSVELFLCVLQFISEDIGKIEEISIFAMEVLVLLHKPVKLSLLGIELL